MVGRESVDLNQDQEVHECVANHLVLGDDKSSRIPAQHRHRLETAKKGDVVQLREMRLRLIERG